MINVTGEFNKATIYTDIVDKQTIGQIIDLCNQKFVQGETIRIMPDCHMGVGCTIGTTMTLTDKVVPNLVGVDIGCGMLVAKLKKESNFSLEHLDSFITHSIPSGSSVRTEIHAQAKGRLNLDKLRCASVVDIDRAEKSVGTLGGGNHFIEVSKDENTNDIYIIIHSGSRHLGKQVAEYYQKIAIAYHKGKQDREVKELIKECKEAGSAYKISHILEDRKFRKIPEHLAYLEGQDFEDYIHDMKIIQRYAEINREVMLVDILKAMGCEVEEVFHTIHNYIDMRNKENLILRKGAVSAIKGEKLLIPINMRDGSLLCRGKGNPEWNNSAPHGAGRLMSRKQAKEQLSMEEFKEQMKGIHTTSVVESTLDEAPNAYKSIDDIVNNIDDTVDIIGVLKPVYNFKAH